MPSLLTLLKSLVPGYSPTPPTAAPLVLESPEERVQRVLSDAQVRLEESSRRPRPSTEEKLPANYFHGVAGKIWFLPFADSVTKDTPQIRAAMRLMRRDPYVKAAWEPQLFKVASEDWQVHPSEKKNPLAEEQADFCKRVIEDYLDGGMMALVRSICAPLGSDGFSLAEKVWAVAERGRLEKRIICSALKAKDPNDLHLEGDRYNNVQSVTSLKKHGERYPITDFLYSRYLTVFNEPMAEAAFRPAYGAYWMRDTVRKLRVIHHEKKMAGMLVGTYLNPDDKGTLESALERAKSATWLAVPEGVQIQALAISTAAEPDYKSFDESNRDEIVQAIAFATLQILTSSVSDPRGDSKVQKTMADLGPWYLMAIVMDTVNNQLFPDLIDFNFPFPAAGGYPKLTFGAVSNQELIETISLLEGAQRVGLKPSRKHYAEALSIKESKPDDPDDQMQPAGAAPPGPGGMGGGAGLGFFSEEWQPYQGDRGGKGWKNSRTGEVRYQEAKPTDGGEGQESEEDKAVRLRIEKRKSHKERSASWFETEGNRLRIKDPEKRHEMAEEMKAVFSQLPLPMSDQIMSQMGMDEEPWIYPDQDSLNNKVRLRHKALTGTDYPEGKRISGTYTFDGNSARLMIDGGSASGFQRARDVYAHELGHVLDGPHFSISGSSDWIKAWHEEINIETEPLSRYARKDPHEGLAELVRLLGTGASHGYKSFPKCIAALKSRGLI